MSDIMKEFDIIIGTTAVTRHDLHAITFPKYIDFIRGLNVLWIINIDSILNEDPEFTKQHILDMCNNESIEIVFNISMANASRSSFYNAALTVINIISKFDCKYGILWLEDDWEYYGHTKLIDIIDTVNDSTYLQLVERPNVVSFNPGVWSMDLFSTILLNRINDINNIHYEINPERACVSPRESIDPLITSHFKIPCFRDIGRDWQNKTIKTRTFLYKK